VLRSGQFVVVLLSGCPAGSGGAEALRSFAVINFVASISIWLINLCALNSAYDFVASRRHQIDHPLTAYRKATNARFVIENEMACV
jgi:hypothetical protein